MGKRNRLNLDSLFLPHFGRRQLASNNDGMLSYGVRNSIAAYLSFSDSPETSHTRAESRKKSKSVYGLPESAAASYDA